MFLIGCAQELADTHTVETEEANDHAAVVKASRAMVPLPPWPAGDQRGMANTLGAGTWMRCAYHLNQPDARVYELSHLRSNETPLLFCSMPRLISVTASRWKLVSKLMV